MQQGQQIQLPALTFVNKTLIIATVTLFLVDSLLMKSMSFSLVHIFGLVPAKVLSGHLHELLLYPFYSNSLMTIVFNALLLWFIGSELENLWGMRKYIIFLVISYVGAGLIYFLAGVTLFQSQSGAPLTGLHGICSSLCMAYAVLFPNRIFSFMLIFPMKAKYFCMILIGMELYMAFIPGALQSWGHLAAMFFAFGFMWAMTKTSFKNLVEKDFSSPKRQKVPKNSHLRIVKEEEDQNKPPKYWQ